MIGAQQAKGGWRSAVVFKKKRYNLGLFPTPEEAQAAYIEAQDAILDGRTPVEYRRPPKTPKPPRPKMPRRPRRNTFAERMADVKPKVRLYPNQKS